MWGRAPWPLGHSVRPAGHRKGAETRAVSSGCADPRPCLVCFSSRLTAGVNGPGRAPLHVPRGTNLGASLILGRRLRIMPARGPGSYVSFGRRLYANVWMVPPGMWQ